jgi:hypothetical protein
LNVHNVSDVRQIEIHIAEPLVPGPSHLEVEISIAKLKTSNLTILFSSARCSQTPSVYVPPLISETMFHTHKEPNVKL